MRLFTTLHGFALALGLSVSCVCAQDQTEFPGKLDPEAMSRTSELTPPPILRGRTAELPDNIVQPSANATQQSTTWQSVAPL